MKMRYAGLIVCAWCVLWGQETPKNQHSPASTASNHASDSAKIVPPPSTVVNPSVAAPQSQPAAANAQQQTQTDPSIWFLRPEWVIVWVTLVYTILTYFTLRTIKRQADLMGDQLDDARKDSEDSARTTAKTLEAMQEQAKFLLLQANHMVDHKLVMIEALNASRKSADATFAQFEAVKRTQRAQIRIEFSDLDLTFDERYGGYPVFFKIIMDGSTRAYIVQQSIVADIPELPREDRRYWANIGLPVNFTPEMSPFEGFVLLRTNELPPELETNEAKIQLVRDHIRVVRVHGGIVYRDIFGDCWRLSIHRAWDYRVGMWVGTGSVPEDEHRQIKDQRTKDQTQPFEPANPN